MLEMLSLFDPQSLSWDIPAIGFSLGSTPRKITTPVIAASDQ
ncbi:hypothetical protein [Herbidospora mongoliensis]|nr:hypothetical protein [Herbidospora mongoliensis]